MQDPTQCLCPTAQAPADPHLLPARAVTHANQERESELRSLLLYAKLSPNSEAFASLGRGLGQARNEDVQIRGKASGPKERMGQMNSQGGSVEQSYCREMYQEGKKIKWMVGAASEGLYLQLE